MVEKEVNVPTTKFTGFTINKTNKVNVTSKRKSSSDTEFVDYISDITSHQITSVTPISTAEGPKVIPLSMQLPSFKKQKVATTSSIVSSFLSTTSASTGDMSIDQLAAAQVIQEVMDIKQGIKEEVRVVPLCLQNPIDGISGISDESERFKHDVNNRPDDPTEEEYEEMPIESFGEAMLRGMGWCPGGLIGMNNRGLAEPIEFVKRAGIRLGLGATPKELISPPSVDDDKTKKKKIIKPGESRDPKPIMVAKPGPDGKVRHIKSINEPLVPLVVGLSSGQKVYIIKGKHEGMKGHIVLLKKQWQENGGGDGSRKDDVYIRLRPSEEVVCVSSDFISNSPPPPTTSNRDIDMDKSASHHSKSSKKDSSSSSSSSSSWLRTNIRVRIVSKSYDDGKYYNKKGTIVDVTGDKICIVQLDDCVGLLDNIKQRNLETVLPQVGGTIMVVSGKKAKGRIGVLLSKHKEEATIQLEGDKSVGNFALDDIAQYVGGGEDDYF
eukprot:TRINITY_DN1960_c1_g1_i1.p1 TRINITY_DN1960_c1_g1~~TRINITY_DN1960_c1_g1_i1.p1  ORF type:complete len:494 (-),score=189.56 TRINITY_DN1960_c1_g1_i1:75-1556(-)